MRDDEGKDEDGEEGEREDEHVEETVVPPPHAVPHPGTVVVEALCEDREKKKENHCAYAHTRHLHVYCHAHALLKIPRETRLCTQAEKRADFSKHH